MPRRDYERVQIELDKLEKELSSRLCAELRLVATGRNSNFFITSDYNPQDVRLRDHSKTSPELLELAAKCKDLRELLVLPTENSVGQLFENACVESADIQNPQRLGPLRLAARLLQQIEALHNTSTS